MTETDVIRDFVRRLAASGARRRADGALRAEIESMTSRDLADVGGDRGEMLALLRRGRRGA